jgi:hypothetical protein
MPNGRRSSPLTPMAKLGGPVRKVDIHEVINALFYQSLRGLRLGIAVL